MRGLSARSASPDDSELPRPIRNFGCTLTIQFPFDEPPRGVGPIPPWASAAARRSGDPEQTAPHHRLLSPCLQLFLKRLSLSEESPGGSLPGRKKSSPLHASPRQGAVFLFAFFRSPWRLFSDILNHGRSLLRPANANHVERILRLAPPVQEICKDPLDGFSERGKSMSTRCTYGPLLPELPEIFCAPLQRCEKRALAYVILGASLVDVQGRGALKTPRVMCSRLFETWNDTWWGRASAC